MGIPHIEPILKDNFITTREGYSLFKFSIKPCSLGKYKKKMNLSFSPHPDLLYFQNIIIPIRSLNAR
jgi:hypothetical protein